MKIKMLPLAAVTLAAFTFGIAGASALGYWITESTKQPAKLASGEFAGQADPADIRGSYSFGDVEKAFGVPASVLADAFGFTDRPAAEVKAKDLETLYAGKTGALEVGTDAVRLFTAAWIGMPYEPEPDTGLPARAVELLEGRSMHPATAALVRSRIVDGGTGFGTLSAESAPAPSGTAAAVPGTQTSAAVPPAAPPALPSGPEAETHVPAASAAREVKGSTTFGDLTAWGLTPAQIKEALGGKAPGASTEKVRDLCTAAGIEFSGVKARLQEMIAALP